MPLPAVLPEDDCIRCRGKRWKFGRVVAVGPYQHLLRDYVIRIKRNSDHGLRQALAELLAEQVRQDGLGDGDSLVIPVPNFWTHAFGGAADAAGLLVGVLAKSLRLEAGTRIVRKVRKTGKQGMLPWSERAQNVGGAFVVKHAQCLTGRHVFLVDDVLTSGATAAEVAKVLWAAGASSVDVLVVARGTGTRSL